MDLRLDEPMQTDYEQRLLAGLDFFGDPMRTGAGWTEENEIGRLWKRFMAWLEAHPETSREACASGQMYEVHVLHPETEETGEWEVFVGLPFPVVAELPATLVAKVLPAGPYACFTLHGEEITADWPLAVSAWLDEHGYRPRTPFSYELYDGRFKGVDDIAGSVIEAHVPLMR